MMRRAFASELEVNGAVLRIDPDTGAGVAGNPFRFAGSAGGGVRMSWLRSAPPSLTGSGQRLAEVPPCPKSTQLKLAPSPPLTYSLLSGPNASEPIEWLGYCWHQSSMITCSEPSGRMRDRRPLTLQPAPVASPQASL